MEYYSFSIDVHLPMKSGIRPVKLLSLILLQMYFEKKLVGKSGTVTFELRK